MTIAALSVLLDQELPHVQRHPAPWIPHTAHKRKETDMNQSPDPRAAHPAPPAEYSQPTPLPVGQLLAWAASHPDKSLRDQAGKARDAIDILRARHQAMTELAEIDTETAELEKRLAELRARQAELAPRKRAKAVRDYEAGEVRAWARANGHRVPDRGQIPRATLQAWRERSGISA